MARLLSMQPKQHDLSLTFALSFIFRDTKIPYTGVSQTWTLPHCVRMWGDEMHVAVPRSVKRPCKFRNCSQSVQYNVERKSAGIHGNVCYSASGATFYYVKKSIQGNRRNNRHSWTTILKTLAQKNGTFFFTKFTHVVYQSFTLLFMLSSNGLSKGPGRGKGPEGVRRHWMYPFLRISRIAIRKK